MGEPSSVEVRSSYVIEIVAFCGEAATLGLMAARWRRYRPLPTSYTLIHITELNIEGSANAQRLNSRRCTHSMKPYSCSALTSFRAQRGIPIMVLVRSYVTIQPTLPQVMTESIYWFEYPVEM